MKLRDLVCGDTVHVRNHLNGQVKWAPRNVVRRLGPLTYLTQVHGKRRYVDHIRSTSEVDESVTQYYYFTIYLQLCHNL